jgi:hypothetical protein
MDQSESVVVSNPEGRARELPTMTPALAMDGTTEVNHQSLHLEIDGQHVQLDVGDIVGMEPEQGTEFSKSHLGPTREIVLDDLGIAACVGPSSISTHQVKIDKDVHNVDLSMNKRKRL